MFKTLKRIFGFTKTDNYKEKQSEDTKHSNRSSGTQFSDNLSDNINLLKDLFNNSSDLVTHEFMTGAGKEVLIFYIDGLINKDLLDRDIVKALTESDKKNIKNELLTTSIKEDMPSS